MVERAWVKRIEKIEERVWDAEGLQKPFMIKWRQVGKTREPHIIRKLMGMHGPLHDKIRQGPTTTREFPPRNFYIAVSI